MLILLCLVCLGHDETGLRWPRLSNSRPEKGWSKLSYNIQYTNNGSGGKLHIFWENLLSRDHVLIILFSLNPNLKLLLCFFIWC